jgi:signal peptidase II
VFALAAVLGLAADLISKQLAFARVADAPVVIERTDVLAGGPLHRLIPPHDPVRVIPKLLDFTLVLNPGAVFGIGAGKRWFFIVFTVAAVGFAMWMFARWTRPRDLAVHAAIGLVVAGGLGNLYDRLAFACVRDFIHPLPGMTLPFGWSYPWASGPAGREVWPYVSNVADLLLIIGIVVLVVHTWRMGAPRSSNGPVKGRAA